MVFLLQVAQLLELIKRDPTDPDSASAASNADSGRGTSEPGEHRNSDNSAPVATADTSLDHQRSNVPVKGRQGQPPHNPPPRPPKKHTSTGCHGNNGHMASRTSSCTGAPRLYVKYTLRLSIRVLWKKPTLQDYYPARTILPPGNMRHNYVLDASESASESVSDGGSTTSGSYIVDMDNGTLKAVDV